MVAPVSALIVALWSLPRIQVEEPYGDAVDGLRCALYVSAGSGWIQRPVETLQDLTLDVRLDAGQGGPRRVVLEAEEGANRTTPLLFDLELESADGIAVPLPRWEFHDTVVRAAALVSHHTQVREIRRTWRRLPLADWYGWQGVILEPGSYRIRVVYSWPPESPDASVAASATHPDAWRGTVRSGWRSFAIGGIEHDSEMLSETEYASRILEFGPAVEDLRAAADLLPHGSRYFLGEILQPVFHVENTGSRQLTLDCIAYPHFDVFHARGPAGNDWGGAAGFSTGIPPITRWWLEPGQRIKLRGTPISLAGLRAGSAAPGALEGPPGRYTLSFDVSLQAWTSDSTGDGEPRRLQLSTPEIGFEVLDRRASR